MASILSLRSFLTNSFRKNTRTNLDMQPHFVPLDLNLLETFMYDRLEGIDIASFAREVVAETRSHIPRKIYVVKGTLSADPLGKTLLGLHNIKKYLPAIVYSGLHLKGALFSSYGTVGSSFFTPILNKKFAKYIKHNTAYKGKKIFERAHTEIEHGNDTYIARVPGLLQAENLAKALTSPTTGTSILLADNPEEASELIQGLLDQVQQAREDFTLHSVFGGLVGGSLSKDFKDALLSVKANIILVNTGEENQVEFNIKHETPFQRTLVNIIKKVHFSRNFEEEVKHRVKSAILGKKPPRSTSSAKIAGNTVKRTTKIQKHKGTAKVKLPALRNVQGQSYSLASLQVLINRHLQNVISANMGDEGYPGGQRKILNYRTGRFAASAKVSHLTQSREGMITAFYTYMKNPYQTFEPGFKRGSPMTRDPKLLISKSIREIAATKIGNRLRAVSV